MGRKKKPEGEEFTRMGITLPPDLRQQMESPPGGRTVNWSAVAAESFRRELKRLQAEHTEGKTMGDVIERMRAMELVEGDELYQQGATAAESWVKKRATPKLLRRLEKSVDATEHDAEYFVGLIGNTDIGNAGTAAGIYQALFGLEDTDCRNFWEDVIGLGNEWEEVAGDERFALGFVEKALELWAVIEAKL